MLEKQVLRRIQKYVRPFRITNGKGFRLKDFDPGDTRGLTMDKGEAAELLQRGTEWLAEEQDMLYAQDRWSLLLVFQAMDAAGKDGTIKHVMSGVNPQGCQVFSFKQPSAEELSHDFLWRYAKSLPERGRIGIFGLLGSSLPPRLWMWWSNLASNTRRSIRRRRSSWRPRGPPFPAKNSVSVRYRLSAEAFASRLGCLNRLISTHP